MLRKKISKLIVGVVTAMVLTAVIPNYGQAVYANSKIENTKATNEKQNDNGNALNNLQENNSNKATNIVDGVAHINAQTSQDEIITLIKNENVSKLIVDNGDLPFTSKMVEAINTRTKYLTIELAAHLARLKVQENLAVTPGKLEVSRGSAKTDEMMYFPSTNSSEITISGITFQNNLASGKVFSNLSNLSTITFRNNYVLGGGYLTDNDLASGKPTQVKNNLLSFASISPKRSVTLGGDVYISGQRYVAVVGTLNTTGEVKLDTTGGKSELLVIDSSGKTVATGELVLSGDEAAGKYNFDGVAFRVPPNNQGGGQPLQDGTTEKKYGVYIRFYDQDGNYYVRSVGQVTDKGEIIKPNPDKPNPEPNPPGGTNPEQPKPPTPEPPPTIPPTTPPTGGGTIGGGSGSSGGSGSGGITGGGSGSGSSSSGSSSSITTNDINKSTISDIEVLLTVGSSSLLNSIKEGKDFKTNYEGVTVAYENGKLRIKGLVPDKQYKDLTVTYTDKNNKSMTVNIATFKTSAASTKLKQFIMDVYKYSLDRQADERGFAYWEQQLKSNRSGADKFVMNLLNEREFLAKYTNTSDRIKALYQVIVNRTADTEGLKFWTTKYETLLNSGNTESTALSEISSQMVGEQEFKNRVLGLGI